MTGSNRSASRLPVFGLALVLVLGTIGLGAQGAASPPEPLATEANITRLTTGLLEHSQFAHHPLDNQLAGMFLDRYLDSLDGTRSLFTQSDVNDFAAYRATLAQATRGAGDTRAAQAIFHRYLERLGQQTAYVTNTLRTAEFDFTGHDVYSFDREHAERPHDLAAAQQLWRQQLRSEYLPEKLTDEPPAQIVSKLIRRHTQQLGSMKALRSDDVLEVYLNALAHVYDPHSDYLGHEQMESLAIAMNLSLFGIGASLESADGYTQDSRADPGGTRGAKRPAQVGGPHRGRGSGRQGVRRHRQHAALARRGVDSRPEGIVRHVDGHPGGRLRGITSKDDFARARRDQARRSGGEGPHPRLAHGQGRDASTRCHRPALVLRGDGRNTRELEAEARPRTSPAC